MARPLSEEKRYAILAAAAEAVAELGVSAPTAKIARAAGIAEGTLFSYFQTKDALLNQLFIQIKHEIGAAILVDYRSGNSLAHGLRRAWERYIDWGTANPAKRRAMVQLAVSDRITKATREASAHVLHETTDALDEGLRSGVIRKQPLEFVACTIEALSEMTLQFIAREPTLRERYTRTGFETLWNAISKR